MTVSDPNGEIHSGASAQVAVSQPGGVSAPRVKRPPSPSAYALLAINLVVFLAMLPGSPIQAAWQQHRFCQVLTTEFSLDGLWRFGGCERVSVIAGHQWWRPVTATFVHASVLHLAVNMWCLWNLAVFGEPLLGRPGLVAVYLLTGTAGNLLSMGWDRLRGTDALVVGASGAVFGLAGILIVLLSNRKLSLPWEQLRGLRRQVILFAAANLAFGAGPGLLPLLGPGSLRAMHMNPASLPQIDNSAHLGGLLYGMLLGVPLFPRMTSGRSSYRARQRLTFAAATLLLCLFGYALSRLG